MTPNYGRGTTVFGDWPGTFSGSGQLEVGPWRPRRHDAAGGQGVAHDVVEDGGGHLAALGGAGRPLHVHRDNVLRVVGRREADEGRDVATAGVPAGLGVGP